ncbi:uncharacterized protein LOC123674560 [Harmonia axyridis]|uniref:uncharacterized protein LOC123674560 n=1 Tax=Harmonia axyridis TaxID=115357 RepID=UPI001E276F64|nr:uncharacterized protein LOC123674560 [Harmonia axyridis]
MVILLDDTPKMFSYNPFKKKIRELFNDELFPHYLNNMEEFNLRVSMFEQWPRVSKKSGQWRGEDVTLLQILGKLLNANITIVETPAKDGYEGAYESIMNNESDFCFVKFFQVDEFDDIEFSAPLELNSIELMVPNPKPIPTYLTIFMVFSVGSWAFIAVMFILVIVCFKVFSMCLNTPKKWKLGDIIMMMILIALNWSVKNLEKVQKLLRIVLFPYIIISLIVSVAFQSHLLTRLQFMFYYDEIRNLKDVALSGFPIYTFVHLPYPPPEIIKDQVIALSHLNYSRLTEGRKLVVLGLPFLQRKSPPRKPGTPNRFKFYPIDQVLARGYGVYMFRKHSPFVSKISRVMSSIKQYALTESKVVDKSSRIVEDIKMEDFDKDYLTLFEMASVFCILIFGLALSILIFLAELYYVKFQ